MDIKPAANDSARKRRTSREHDALLPYLKNSEFMKLLKRVEIEGLTTFGGGADPDAK